MLIAAGIPKSRKMLGENVSRFLLEYIPLLYQPCFRPPIKRIRQVSIPYCNNETTRDQSCISNLNGDFEKYMCSFLEDVFPSFVISLLYSCAFTNMPMINHRASRNINKTNYLTSNTDSINPL